MSPYVPRLVVGAWLGWIVGCEGCGFPRPADVGDAAGGDASNAVCVADAALRCAESALVRCNAEGTAEIMESCLLGCRASAPRCLDIDPSNGLAQALDMAAAEPALDLGTAATINADDGTVTIDGQLTVVKSATVTQIGAPTIRVFLVRSLRANDVTVSGVNAIAVASSGDITLDGVFAASAIVTTRGAGAFNDASCTGADIRTVGGAFSGAGGGGFAFAGGRGGAASNEGGVANGTNGGMPTGTPTLVPLRGGCDSGRIGDLAGRGGGAIQLVSRTKIVVAGVVAANGSSVIGGGSGGGVMLEAPVIEVTGRVVANGGAGAAGCLLAIPGETARYDATPAAGGVPCNANGGRGGSGAAGNFAAGTGDGITGTGPVFGGHGGGSVGRIRLNATVGGLHATGLFSPNPSTGSIATR